MNPKLESHIVPWFKKLVKGLQIEPSTFDLERQPWDFDA
jgi:hypothetical protein